MQYYRVQFKEDYTYYLVNRETRKDSIITNTYWGVSQYYDTALMDGKPGSSNDFDSNIEFVPPIQNYYRVFSSAYFSNRQYTMILETAPTYPWDTENYEIKKQLAMPLSSIMLSHPMNIGTCWQPVLTMIMIIVIHWKFLLSFPTI